MVEMTAAKADWLANSHEHVRQDQRGKERTRLTFAYEYGRKIVVQDDQQEIKVLTFEFCELDLIIRSSCWLPDPGKDSLQEWRQKCIEYLKDLRLESIDNLIQQPQKESHLIFTGCLR